MTTWLEQYKQDITDEVQRCCVGIAKHFSEQDRLGVFGRPVLRHYDAGETMALTAQLTEYMTETFVTEFGPTLAMSIIPVDDRPTPAESITYEQVTNVGAAKELAHYGEDIPTVDAYGAKYTHTVIAAACSYLIDIQSLRAAAMAGIPIETRKEDSAQLAIAQWLDDLAFTGSTRFNIKGLFNHASVPSPITATTGTWSTATGAQIVGDVMTLINAVNSQSKQTRNANTLLCDPAQFGYMDKNVAYTSLSAKQMVLSTTGITRIQPLAKLALADHDSTKPRLVAFEASPAVLRLRITQPFELMAPQLSNLTYKTIAHCRSAGLMVYKPYGIAYMDEC